MLSWEFPPHNVGGLGKHVTELVPALARAGVEVHLVTPRWGGGVDQEVLDVADGGPDRPPPITVHRVEPPGAEMPDFFTGAWRTNVSIEEYAKRLIDRETYDLIHAHDWLVAFSGVALKNAYRIPLLATIHATEHGRNRGTLQGEIPRAIHNVEWWLTYEAWRVIACSDYMAREIANVFRTPPDKIDVVPNGVDTGPFDRLDGEDLTEFRRRFALDDEQIIFYVGRVVHEKGVHLLVEAMPQILAQRPSAKLVVAGTGGSLAYARERAEALGLGGKAVFTGFIPDEDRNRLFRVANVAAFPSLYEPFGIVALEAMAARTPVIVADVGGLSEVVQNHETGLTIYPDNLDSLTWGVLHTLNNPEWARQRVENAYRVVRERFNWDTIAQSTAAVYRRIAAERKTADW